MRLMSYMVTATLSGETWRVDNHLSLQTTLVNVFNMPDDEAESLVCFAIGEMYEAFFNGLDQSLVNCNKYGFHILTTAIEVEDASAAQDWC